MVKIVPLSNGGYGLEEGGVTLTACPCCGKMLTLPAAQALVKGVENGEETMRSLVELSLLRGDPNSRTGSQGEGNGPATH